MPLNSMMGVTEGKNDALHLGAKHGPGQGVRKGEGGNVAEDTVVVLLVVPLCQQRGPADKQKYVSAVPSKHKMNLAAALLLPSKSYAKCPFCNNSGNKRKGILENVVIV